MDALGFATFKRTYSRDGESWEQTLRRVCNACRTQLSIPFTPTEFEEVYLLMHELKCVVAGRALWQLGTGTVDRLGLMSLQNCAFVVIDEDVDPFTWAFDALMLGCGVGFRLLPSDVSKLSRVYHTDIRRSDTTDADFIVPDSREGWVKLLKKVLKAFHNPSESKRMFSYSLHCLRSKDTPIKTFGGKASGPIVLEEGIEVICEILNRVVELNSGILQSVDALDIMNIIGRIVVSGNVRRCIAAGSKVWIHKQELIYDYEVSIENVVEGDMIYARNGIYQRVMKVYSQGKQSVMTIRLEQPSGSLRCTPNHRIILFGGEVKYAKELSTSDSLIGLEGERVGISSIVNTGFDRVSTYDLEISGLTYTEKSFGGYFYCSGVLVHNSAEIAIGSASDEPFLSAKRWDLGSIPNYRCYSNNTVVCENTETDLPATFWDGYTGNGEPYGIFNLSLSQSCGRLGETQYPDRLVQGTNPCSEQTLESYETCCLAELVLPKMQSRAELFKCAEYMYRINKHILALPCHQKRTEVIVHKNYRMGIGITGWMQASEEQRSWLDSCYLHLREYDDVYSAEMGFPRSIKLTTVKPSGTLSLICGVTPGIHPAFSQYYIRRVRFAFGSELVKTLHRMGYNLENQRNFDGTIDHSTEIIDFPCSVPEGTILARDVSAIYQLEVVKRLQTEWSDNSVSVTVYYRLEELDSIKEWLKDNFTAGLKSCSFLLHSEHGFDQAPYEEITKDKYDELMAHVVVHSDLDSFASELTTVTKEDESYAASECISGQCPVR